MTLLYSVTLINLQLGFLKETGLLKMEEKSEMVKTLLFSKWYVTQCFVCSTVFICNFISVTSSFVPSSMVAGDSVTLTSSIFMTSEVDVPIPSSTIESTTSSHITPTQSVVYTSIEGTTTPTPTVVYVTSGDFKTPNLYTFLLQFQCNSNTNCCTHFQRTVNTNTLYFHCTSFLQTNSYPIQLTTK